MQIIKTIAAAAFAILSLTAQPVAAHDTTTTRVSKPTDADIAAAREKADSVMDLIAARQTDAAIKIISDGSVLFREKVSQLSLVTGQVQNAETLYGPVEKCILSEYSHASEFRVSFEYVCQHREYLMIWSLTVDRLPRGWIISNFNFSDNA